MTTHNSESLNPEQFLAELTRLLVERGPESSEVNALLAGIREANPELYSLGQTAVALRQSYLESRNESPTETKTSRRVPSSAAQARWQGVALGAIVLSVVWAVWTFSSTNSVQDELAAMRKDLANVETLVKSQDHKLPESWKSEIQTAVRAGIPREFTVRIDPDNAKQLQDTLKKTVADAVPKTVPTTIDPEQLASVKSAITSTVEKAVQKKVEVSIDAKTQKTLEDITTKLGQIGSEEHPVRATLSSEGVKQFREQIPPIKSLVTAGLRDAMQPWRHPYVLDLSKQAIGSPEKPTRGVENEGVVVTLPVRVRGKIKIDVSEWKEVSTLLSMIEEQVRKNDGEVTSPSVTRLLQKLNSVYLKGIRPGDALLIDLPRRDK